MIKKQRIITQSVRRHINIQRGEPKKKSEEKSRKKSREDKLYDIPAVPDSALIARNLFLRDKNKADTNLQPLPSEMSYEVA